MEVVLTFFFFLEPCLCPRQLRPVSGGSGRLFRGAESGVHRGTNRPSLLLLSRDIRCHFGQTSGGALSAALSKCRALAWSSGCDSKCWLLKKNLKKHFLFFFFFFSISPVLLSSTSGGALPAFCLRSLRRPAAPLLNPPGRWPSAPSCARRRNQHEMPHSPRFST